MAETTSRSLWTNADSIMLEELVRKRGFADVALHMREIAWRKANHPRVKAKADWERISHMLTRIFDNITEGRALPSKLDG